MKVEDYTPRTRDIELWDFMDNVQVILNNGLYEFRLVSSTPNWQAQQGESAIYYTVATTSGLGSNKRLYVYINNAWVSMSFGSGSGYSGAILSDTDGDTGITPEWSADEDVIRFYVDNTYAFSMSSLGFGIQSDKSLWLDGVTGTARNTYWTCTTNTASTGGYKYLRGYIDGKLRVEM